MSSKKPKKIMNYLGNRKVNRSISDGDPRIIFFDKKLHYKLNRLTVEYSTNENSSYSHFLKHHSCYDIIPLSSKLVVLDVTMNVQKAFYALIYNNVRASILWDSTTNEFTGMLTITDFIKVLVKYYKPELCNMLELETHRIMDWRNSYLTDKPVPLLSINAESSLSDAINVLKKYKVHRLPIFEPGTGNYLHILTHKRVLKYLYLNMHQILPKPAYLSESLEELKLGTYAPNCITIKLATLLIDALRLFLKHHVSCLPILNDESRLVGLYAKFDVIHLAANRTYMDLDNTISDVLDMNSTPFNTQSKMVFSCRKTDTLEKVIIQIVDAGVHRLVITDEDNKFEGIISLSDILTFIIAN